MLETLKELQGIASRLNYDTRKTAGGKAAQAACLQVVADAVKKTIDGAGKDELSALVSDLVAKNKEW